MRFKVSIHMKDIYEYLDNTYLNYLFDPDTSLDLIEIFKLGDAYLGEINQPVNVLYFHENDKDISLMYKTDDQDMLDIEKAAKSFLAEFVKVSEEKC